MSAYIVRRLLLMIPTLFGIMLINFVVIQAAPGGPVEQAIAQLTGQGSSITERVTRDGTGETLNQTATTDSSTGRYRGAQGLDPEFIKELEQRFGFDKPMHERFLKMMGDYLTFDFGNSFFRDRSVIDLVIDKMPVSISLGVWTTLIVYLVSIPLGIAKAVRDGSRFDVATSFALVIGTAIPSFLFAVFLLVVFAGGSYLDWFPLRGLLSEQYLGLGFTGCIASAACVGDYFWHISLPVLA
ncbi:MAG: microcin ABC transporter permease, partial [Burkholderiales bacterium]